MMSEVPNVVRVQSSISMPSPQAMFCVIKSAATMLRSQASFLSHAVRWLAVMLERAHCWARTIMALILSVKVLEPARQNDFASAGLRGKP